MERAIRFAICLIIISLMAAPAIIIISLMAAPAASAATYYIAASGLDSSSGASKTAPWLHAPGMTGCSSNCASYTPQAGDQFIFRGGDTWHTSTGSPIGLPWTWSWSGSSGNPIYIGVDQTWYSGGSWTRPILTYDNPATTSQPSSCTYADDGQTAFSLGYGSSGQTYVTFDNFEITGWCWATGNQSAVTVFGGNHNTLSNCYFHGWSMSTAATGDNFSMVEGNLPGGNYLLITQNVFDGSDSTFGTNTASPHTGEVIYNTGAEVSFNVFNNVSNVMVNEAPHIHDNIFENVFEPLNDSPHGNIWELNGASGTTGEIFLYNNLEIGGNVGVGFDANFTGAGLHIFNNVVVTLGNTGSSTTANCWMIEGGGTQSADIHNNTMSTGCTLPRMVTNWNGAVTFENGHYIGYSPATLATTYSACCTYTVTDNGGELFQTASVASGQGYTTSNNYAPTSSSGSTVGAGNNMTSACNAMPAPTPTYATNPVTSCKAGFQGVTYNTSNHTAVPNAAGNARPSSGAWDVGAYQYAGSSTPQKPNPPTGLSVTVQ